MPVFGDVAHVRGALLDGGLGNILAAELDLALGQRLQAGQAEDELGLAVAIDAGDADDLARTHVQGDLVDGVALVELGGDGHVFNVQDDVLRLGRLFDDLELNGAADHHVRQLLLVGVLRVDGADVAALAQNGHAVRNGHDLIELVGDEEDAFALGGEVFHDLHQLVDLLRGQHGGGLVEDEDLIVAVQHLQDLGALLHADGDVLHLRVQVDLQAVLFTQGLDLFAGLLLLQEAELGILCAEDDVIQHGEDLDQLEVLVHHADVECGRVIGVVDLDGLAVLADFTRFRLIQAEQNAHQRGFAGAVFTEQGVDLAFFQLQGDVVVCLDAGELLRDMKHLNHVLRSISHKRHLLSCSDFLPA